MKNIVLKTKKTKVLWTFVSVTILLLVLALTSSCSRLSTEEDRQMASPIVEKIGCKSFKSQIFDSFYYRVDQQKTEIDISQLSRTFRTMFNQKYLGSAVLADFADKQSDLLRLQELVIQVLSLLDEQRRQASSEDKQIQRLIALESGSIAQEELKKSKIQIEKYLAEIDFLAEKNDLNCESELSSDQANAVAQASSSLQAPTPGQSQAQSSSPAIGQSQSQTLIAGAHFAFAHSYQSCDVLRLPDLTLQIPQVEGVAKDQSVDGIGWGRKYINIQQILDSHYYWRNISSLERGCLDIRKKPLVYDYGGVPAWDGKSSLNFFVNAGDGGPALGVDCSAFVSAAIAKSGLRYAPGLENKPIYVRRTSYEFLDPESNGLSCFQRIPLDGIKTINDGDIFSVPGHVVILDRVSADPWGIGRIQKVDNCLKLTYKNFDFSVLQSSSSKNSIGINRFRVVDYLEETENKRAAFEKYAKQSCLNYFAKKNSTPKYSDVSIIRHKMTAECLSTQRVEFNNESCVSSCRD